MAMPRIPMWARSLPALVLVALIACSGPSADTPAGPDRALAPAADRDIAAAIRAQERHTPGLMAIPGVVGTAVGLAGDGPVVKVFLARSGIPGIPARLDHIPVAIEVTGMFVAGSDPTSRSRPAPVGFSIGHPSITAGTLGARVVDATGNVYILSNNHVIANSNNASIGDPILQPGPYDGGTSADSLAWLSDFQAIDFSGGSNTMDAGVARTVTGNVGFATPTDDAYGAPSSQVFGDGNGDGLFDDKNQLLGLNVMKYGRTTGFTSGQISEINVTVSVCYETRGPFMCARAATFTDQIGIASETFSAGGDSGSLIVSQSGKNPVGLLFAGSTTRTLANRVDLVLDRFNVTVDDGSGGGGDPVNSPPTASFTFTCSELACDFDGTSSSDSDGTVVSSTWNFGDGTSGSGTTVSHTFTDPGDYTVTLTVTDDDGAPDSDSQTVSVSSGGGGGTTMHIGDLDRASANNGSSWTATVTIRVHDSSHGAVSGAVVSGSWSNGASGTAACTTGSTGTCSVSTGGIPKRTSSVLFSVSGVTNSLSYAPAANHDPDGDSNGTSITVLKP